MQEVHFVSHSSQMHSFMHGLKEISGSHMYVIKLDEVVCLPPRQKLDLHVNKL